jgi:hypothetical protein
MAGGLNMGLRIWTLIVIDVFFCVGLLVLVFLGGSEYLWSMISCIALICYVTWSIVQLMQKARQPSDLPK